MSRRCARRGQTPVPQQNLLPDEQRVKIQALERAYAHVLRELIQAVNPALSLHKHRVTAITMIAFGAINWTYTWFDTSGPLSLDEVARLTSSLLLNGLESA